MATLTTSYQLLAQTYLGNSYGDLYVRIYAKYSAQEIANNRTKVQYQARAYFSGNYILDKQGSGYAAGTSASTITGSCTRPTEGETVIATTEAWVAHYSNGTGSISATAYLNFPNWGWSGTASATANLPTIPRQATISSAPNFNDEANPTLYYNNPAGTAVSSLQACISLTGSADNVAYRDISKTGSSYTFNLTDAEREVLRNATLSNSTSRTVYFYVRTVISGTTYYSSAVVTFSVINCSPTLEPTVKDINETTVGLTGDASSMIRYFSNAEVSTGAQTYKNASVASQKVICGGKSVAVASGTIEAVESGNFVFSVTDNRGITVTKTIITPFIEYIKLTCDLLAKAPDAEGDVTFGIRGNYYGGSFGLQDNTLAVEYRYKTSQSEYTDWIKAEPVIEGSEYMAEVGLSGLDYQETYTFQARATDALMEKESTEEAVKTVPVFDWSGDDFNFNVPVTIQGMNVKDTVTELNSKISTTNNALKTLMDVKAKSTDNAPLITDTDSFLWRAASDFPCGSINIPTYTTGIYITNGGSDGILMGVDYLNNFYLGFRNGSTWGCRKI